MAEAQRITLYLPARLLDMAEAQASRAGVETLQRYCEGLLARAIEMERGRETLEATEARFGTFDGLDEVANDPEYLAEWTASIVAHEKPAEPQENGYSPQGGLPAAASILISGARRPPSKPFCGTRAWPVTIYRLPPPRCGEPSRSRLRRPGNPPGQGRPGGRAGRRGLHRPPPAAHALHRLAFEGQVLLTDGWHGARPRPTPRRSVSCGSCKGVDRVLSGEDYSLPPRSHLDMSALAGES